MNYHYNYVIYMTWITLIAVVVILNYGCNYVIYTGWITLIAVLAILNGS